MSAWTLCIDFGTAFSKAAAAPSEAWSAFDAGAVRPLMLAGGAAGANPFLLDSAVFVDDAEIVFGRPALARAEAQAARKRAALRSFKTLLSARDVDQALNANALASLDPHRAFKMRDLVVLYLAHLLSAVDEAVAADQRLAGASAVARRCAAPAWRDAQPANLHAALAGLFGEAAALQRLLGDALRGGLGVAAAVEALARARAAATPAPLGLVFEATAAAAYSSIGLGGGGSHFVVVDVGAGTTDIAALAQRAQGLTEFAEARATLAQAGDFIDRVIANAFVSRARHAKSVAEQTELWRLAIADMSALKDSLFADGRASLRHDGRVVSVALREVEQSEDFSAFARELTQAFQRALELAARDVAENGGGGGVNTIAVGGGASAPFVQRLLRTNPRARAAVTPLPATPAWAHSAAFQGNLAPVFPQLAIAIGGALAPDAMLAWRSR